jgi:EAL domain-containing protein (putative c-di-GMP-specific phosphodiesterase class I)/ActR/RegA family two-component response regulator
MQAQQAVTELTHQIVLILDDDPMITEGLSALLERQGRTLITCNDVESGEMIVDWIHPSLVVSDLRLTGPFSLEGLDFIRFAKRQSPETRVIVMTADAPDALQLEAAERGAVAFLRKPFEVAELDAFIDLMSAPARAGSGVWPTVMKVPPLDEILTTNSIYTMFQPIVNLETGTAIGYEALTRCRSEAPVQNPEVLFKYAEKKHRVCDLEMASMSRSLRSAAAFLQGSSLFLNVHPAVFNASRDLPRVLEQRAAEASVPLTAIVLEITEQGSLDNGLKPFHTIDQLREMGVRFALDDVGVAYSHLGSIEKIRPSFLKVSQHFGSSFELDGTKSKIVRNIISLARDFECVPILEGVETAATAIAAKDLRIPYAQGYFFSPPMDVSVLSAEGEEPHRSFPR